MKCRLYNKLGLGILTFQLQFSEPRVSTEEEVGGLIIWLWLDSQTNAGSVTQTTGSSIFLNDTKAAMPRRSDVASLIIQADMWIGKHVPNIWKQKDQTDYSSDQARGAMWGAAESSQKDGWTKPNKSRRPQSTLPRTARCECMCERLGYTQGFPQKTRNVVKFYTLPPVREGPLGWSDQLHNADTFSLTSVKLA